MEQEAKLRDKLFTKSKLDMWKFEVRVGLFVVIALLGLSLTATATAFGIKALLEEGINQSGTMKPLKSKIFIVTKIKNFTY